jgi:putative addiction module component (TIGR02574 family)
MKKIDISTIFELTISQRILLAQEIWDSVIKNPESIPLTEKQKKELDKRITAYIKNPDQGKPWSEVKNNILSSN